MAPRQEQQQQQQEEQISNGGRNEQANGVQPRGHISEEIISPVSLLRSDRFVRKGLTASPPGQGQFWQPADIRPATASFTDANNRARYRRDQQRLQIELNDNVQQRRPCSAPRGVTPKAERSNMMRKDRNYGSSVDKAELSENSGTEIMHSQLDKTKNIYGDLKEDEDGSAETRAISTSRETCVEQQTNPIPPSISRTEPQKARLSQSPIRASSILSRCGQFQPSPLKSRRDGSKEVNALDKARSSEKFGTWINRSQLDKTSIICEGTEEDQNGIAETRRNFRKSSVEQQIDPIPSSTSRTEPQGALLSQSPIRASSASSSSGQFQLSPLKSRPMTGTIRSPSQNEQFSYLDNQLHQRIRAFEAEQQVSRTGTRISISPLTNRQGTASDDWAQGEKLPDPCMVRESHHSAALINLTLTSR
ncbi:hypothetical protein R1flu_009410 [Riccia fluitans]|uniref:Uncharacterized protein n=1 Tax=Riccia fluitans TaxID=41844 RepID=A0ABD1Z2T1_9MARC